MNVLARAVLMINLLVLPVGAWAQTSGSGFAHRWEIAGEVGYFTGASLGSVDANLRANSPTPQPYPLFTTQTDVAGALLWEARLGFALAPRIDIEGHLGFSQPELETSVRADAEGAAPVSVVERVDQYVIDAGVVIRIDEMRVGGLVPYAAGGAGYLRQLHEGLTVIEQGHVYHLGGGVKRSFVTRTRGIVKAAGLRADARMYFLSGGISVNDHVSRHGALTAGVFLRF